MQLKTCKATREESGGALLLILLKKAGVMLVRNSKTGGCRKSWIENNFGISTFAAV